MVTYHSTICPACGLLCDDLIVEQTVHESLQISNTTCPKAKNFFAMSTEPVSAKIRGKSVDILSAYHYANELLHKAKQTLISGLMTDILGMQSIIPFAQKFDAIFDQAGSEGYFSGLQAMQNYGAQLTTLTELKNRADVLVVIESDIEQHHPRFFERIVGNRPIKIVYLGEKHLDVKRFSSNLTISFESIFCPKSELFIILAALSGFAYGFDKLTYDKTPWIKELLSVLENAQYAVITWSAEDFNFPNADLLIQQIHRFIAELNKKNRVSGLPLGGSAGLQSVNQASAFLTGFPARQGRDIFDAHRFFSERLLCREEVDLLVWIDQLYIPNLAVPTHNVPQNIVIGHSALANVPCEVFIPTGMIGINQKGVLSRVDNVVSLSLLPLVQTKLPSLANVLMAIMDD